MLTTSQKPSTLPGQRNKGDVWKKRAMVGYLAVSQVPGDAETCARRFGRRR